MSEPCNKKQQSTMNSNSATRYLNWSAYKTPLSILTNKLYVNKQCTSEDDNT
jgi:hypothetical protein